MADLFKGRLFRFVAVCLSLYAVASCFTEAPGLILVMNDLLMSAAAGVCIAYAPILPVALRNTHPTKGEYLGTGIFFVSLCMFLLRVASTIGRDLGWPEIYNTDAITFCYAIGLIGALMHLYAPKVEEGRVPPERWVTTGMLVAAGLFLSLLGWTAHMSLTHPTIIELR